VLLNMDLGELPDEPEGLYASAQIANVACGGHAGDEASMRRAVDLCLRNGTRLGTHPSFPDREGFGRRRIAISPAELRASVSEQCARLAAVAQAAGEVPHFVKAHGALYHAAREDVDVADALVEGARAALGDSVAFLGPPDGELRHRVARAGLEYLREGFADRATRADGTLVPRDQPGALIVDPAVAASQASALATSGRVDTVCVHGDTPGAEAIARAVRAALDARSSG
jgi:5-oxoprolinase (ATP-hydrolysing) subunit A